MPNFSIPLSGLTASDTALATISNNLANLNTVGYKETTVNFQDMFYQLLGSNGSGDKMQVGAGTTVASINTNFASGSAQNTGVSTDVAISGNGFFVIQNGSETSYTRAGNFTKDGTGNLVSAALVAPMPLAQSVPGTPTPLINLGGGQGPWTIVILLTLLTLIPALLLSMTPFVRLLIVFHFLRQALGTQTTPTNQTLIGLALVLTFFLMQPVGVAIQQQAIIPLEAGRITPLAAVDIGSRPVKSFMLHYVREKDVALFLELAKEPRPKKPEDLSMRVVMPAYILSELKAGFQIGAVLFLPFLVIDMVVASITTSVGMMQLPPVVISTPLKLLLFVMVDGWNLLIGSLMRSFG